MRSPFAIRSWFRVLMLATLVATPARAGSRGDAQKLDALLSSADWKDFVTALGDCRRENPKMFFPIELMRLDEVSVDDLLRIVKNYSMIWRKSLAEFASGPERKHALSHVSCDANTEIEAFFKNAQRRSPKSIKGSTVALLKSFPDGQRRALSLLDNVFFQSSDLGKKILADLRKHPELNLEAFSYDEREGLVTFEGNPGAWANLNLAPKSYYELRFGNFNGDKNWKFRGTFVGDSTPVSSDVVQSKDNYRGFVLNPTSSSSGFPFGEFPSGKQVFKDETGLSHYAGDGHHHSH